MSLPDKFTRVKIQEQITYGYRGSDHITYYGMFLGRFFKDETRKIRVSEFSTEKYPIYIFKKETIVKATGQGEVSNVVRKDKNKIKLFTFNQFMDSLKPDLDDMSPEPIMIPDPDTKTLFEEIHKWNNSNNADNRIALPNKENARYSEFLKGKMPIADTSESKSSNVEKQTKNPLSRFLGRTFGSFDLRNYTLNEDQDYLTPMKIVIDKDDVESIKQIETYWKDKNPSGSFVTSIIGLMIGKYPNLLIYSLENDRLLVAEYLFTCIKSESGTFVQTDSDLSFYVELLVKHCKFFDKIKQDVYKNSKLNQSQKRDDFFEVTDHFQFQHTGLIRAKKPEFIQRKLKILFSMVVFFYRPVMSQALENHINILESIVIFSQDFETNVNRLISTDEHFKKLYSLTEFSYAEDIEKSLDLLKEKVFPGKTITSQNVKKKKVEITEPEFNIKPDDYVKFGNYYYLVVKYVEPKKILVKVEGRTRKPPESSTVFNTEKLPPGIKIFKHKSGGSSNKTKKHILNINNNRNTIKKIKKQTKKSKSYKRRTIKKH